MKQYAVIVAGGSGTRMGGGIPKQFRSLCSRPLLWWGIKAFHEQNAETEIIVVLPKDFIALWNDFFSALPESERFPHRIVSGGESRSGSVKNGLSLITEEDSLVAVHDGARPMVSSAMIEKGWIAAEETGAAIPAVAVTDSLREVNGEENHAVDRSRYVSVQTPQVFKTALLKEAYRNAGSRIFTDDAAVVENYGHKITLFRGDPGNIKVTHPIDFEIVELMLTKYAGIS